MLKQNSNSRNWRLPRRWVLSLLVGAFVIEGTLLSSDFLMPRAAGQAFEVKIPKDKLSDKRKEKTSELRAGSGKLTATAELYRDFMIPVISNLQPQTIPEINAVRRFFEEDLDAINRAPRSFRDQFNKIVLNELKRVITLPNTENNQAARVTAFGLAMQLYAEPAGNAPAFPSKDLISLLAAALKPEETSDAIKYMALDTLDRFARLKPTDPNDGLSEVYRKGFINLIDSGVLQLEAPYYRLPKAHQKILEQGLITLTGLAMHGTPAAESTKTANEVAIKFISNAMSDPRSSEWLKETCCWSLGSITIPQNILTPEQVISLENEIGAFATKSIKDWRIKIAKSGAAGGMGMGSSSMDSGMLGTSGGSSSEDYGGLMGGSGMSQPAARPQPPEVRNARRMMHQRLERLHIGFNGYPGVPARGAAPERVTTKGLVALVPEGERKAVAYAIECLDKFQKDLNEQNVADLGKLQTVVQVSLRDFRTACKEISGDRIPEDVGANSSYDIFNPSNSGGAAGQPKGNAGSDMPVPGNGASNPLAGPRGGAGGQPGGAPGMPGPANPNGGNPAAGGGNTGAGAPGAPSMPR